MRSKKSPTLMKLRPCRIQEVAQQQLSIAKDLTAMSLDRMIVDNVEDLLIREGLPSDIGLDEKGWGYLLSGGSTYEWISHRVPMYSIMIFYGLYAPHLQDVYPDSMIFSRRSATAGAFASGHLGVFRRNSYAVSLIEPYIMYDHSENISVFLGSANDVEGEVRLLFMVAEPMGVRVSR